MTAAAESASDEKHVADVYLLRLKIGFVSLLVGIVIGFNVLVSTSNSKTAQNWRTMCYVEMLGQNATYYDEVLTMSTYASVYSGQLKWIDRYDETVPHLDEVFANVEANAAEEASVFFAKTETANIELIRMEIEMQDLVRNGSLASAQRIMESDEYARWKTEFLAGVLDLKQRIAEKTLADERSVRNTILLISIAFGVFSLVSICAMLLVMHRADIRCNFLRELAQAEGMFTLEAILSDPVALELFRACSVKNFCEESVEFNEAASALIRDFDTFKEAVSSSELTAETGTRAGVARSSDIKKLVKRSQDLSKIYVAEGSDGEINVSGELRKAFLKALDTFEHKSSSDSADVMESLDAFVKALDTCRNTTLELLKANLYLKFVKSSEFTTFLSQRINTPVDELIRRASSMRSTTEHSAFAGSEKSVTLNM